MAVSNMHASGPCPTRTDGSAGSVCTDERGRYAGAHGVDKDSVLARVRTWLTLTEGIEVVEIDVTPVAKTQTAGGK